MIRFVALFILLPCPMLDMARHVSCSNFSADLKGGIDTRPGAWGTADYADWTIRFVNPVVITRVYGDLLAWPKGKIPEGTYFGVLFGLQNSGPEGSTKCDWCADNTFVYVQAAGSHQSPVVRIPIDLKVFGPLPDGVLRVRVASWLNDTGLEIHAEPTFCMEYRKMPPRELISEMYDK